MDRNTLIGTKEPVKPLARIILKDYFNVNGRELKRKLDVNTLLYYTNQVFSSNLRINYR